MRDNNRNTDLFSLTALDQSAKTGVLIGYGLMVLGLFTGMFWIIGAIWAMVKRSNSLGSPLEDHYTNIINTFWWGFILTVIGFIASFIVVGYFLMFAVWIWSIYRIVNGIVKITANKPYYY